MDLAQLYQEFVSKYAAEAATIAKYDKLEKEIGPGAFENLKRLKRLASKGREATEKRIKSPAGRDALTELVSEFNRFGTKAVLLTGAQRGGDFLNNQLRGQWAERVALSMTIDGLRFVPFGPSGAAMPGEADHREVIMTYMEIQLLEGKRPDLLGFDVAIWNQLTEAERNTIATWPKRRLEGTDAELVKMARCGAEVKNSTWHYQQRREAGGGSLSITVKEEERAEINSWSRKTGCPVIFLQVLFDEIYCMSFRRMEAAIGRKQLYRPGDYSLDTPKSGKATHSLNLDDLCHRCGKVVFPSKSTAEVRTLDNGYVVPFVDLQPAEAAEVDSRVVLDEIEYVEPVTPAGGPPIPNP